MQNLINFSCEQDSNLMGSDFDNEESGVAGIKRYWAVLYVFKFYNSNDIFFSCTVTVCPSGSSSCDIVSIHTVINVTGQFSMSSSSTTAMIFSSPVL